MAGDGEIGMDPRFSLKQYPRKDTIFQHKKSLNFDLIRAKVYREREKSKMTDFMEYVAYILLGVAVGFVSALLSMSEEWITSNKSTYANKLIDGTSNNLFKAWAFFSCISICMAVSASCLTVWWGPGASGSGVAELIAYMNGVNYPNVFSVPTLITKIYGVLMAVCGGLCVGKEGPLAHIGSNLALMIIHLPFESFKWLQNDASKRQFIAAGASAGVSAAFGAPIGGTLFAYEISKPNTFWKFSVLWKIFFSCATAVFTLALFQALFTGGELLVTTSSVLKFGV